MRRYLQSLGRFVGLMVREHIMPVFMSFSRILRFGRLCLHCICRGRHLGDGLKATGKTLPEEWDPKPLWRVAGGGAHDITRLMGMFHLPHSTKTAEAEAGRTKLINRFFAGSRFRDEYRVFAGSDRHRHEELQTP